MQVASESNPARRRKGKGPALVFMAILAAVAVGGVWLWSGPAADAIDEDVVVEVAHGDLLVSVDGDEGEIRPGDYRLLFNEVDGKSEIISMVDPGSHVKKGDVIIELEASSLKDRQVDQEIVVQLAEAAFVRAREALGIVKKQNQAKIKTAQLNLGFAKQDVNKYLEGDYPQALRDAESEVLLKKASRKQAQEKVDWSKKLYAKNFITRSELDRDTLELQHAEVAFKKAEGALALLKKYTHERELAVLKANVEERELGMVVVEDKAKRDLVDAAADLKAKEIRLKREKEKLAKLEEQIVKTKIVAPIDGMVLYIDDKRDDDGLSVGSVVRERQALVRLPTTAKLQAQLKVHEAQLRKVELGMPVEIQTNAIANRTFHGKLSKISVMPDSVHRYGNPQLKVYTATVEFVGPTQGLRPGMSCRGEIIVDQFADVTYVPIQAVVQEEEDTVVYVPGPDGPERRSVKVGIDNNVHVIVTDGLAAGERVLVAPTLFKSYAPKRAVPGYAGEAVGADKPAKPQRKPTAGQQTPSGDS